MRLLNYSFPIRPDAARTSRRVVAAAIREIAVRAPEPVLEHRQREPVVDGLGHYIDGRLSGERFRID